MARLDSITATYRIVTPLFLGDAERAATRFSLASFKGALRFWWRALAWAEHFRQAGGDERQALRTLHDAEARLFGAAGEERRKDVGQSRVIMRVASVELGEPLKPPDSMNATGTGVVRQPREDGPGLLGSGARYLGYGCINAFRTWRRDNGQIVVDARGRNVIDKHFAELERSCFPAHGRFVVELLLRPDLSVHERDSLIAALKFLGLLGGLGARSRRGWGSLVLESLRCSELSPFLAPTTAEGYESALNAVLPKLASISEPPFTAFSGLSRIEIVHEDKDAVPALDHVGKEMQRYRAWGRGGRVSVSSSEKNFINDHDWFKQVDDQSIDDWLPERMAFGLPHNYGRTADRQAIGVKPEVGDRRASPLLVHVHALGEGHFIGVMTLMPARFLPKGCKIHLDHPRRYGRGGRDIAVPAAWDYVLQDFLDTSRPLQLHQTSKPPKYFPKKRIILP